MLSHARYPLIPIILSMAVFALQCNKPKEGTGQGTDIIAYSLNVADGRTVLLTAPHIVSVQVPGSVTSGAGLIASFELSAGATAVIQNQPQQSGATANDFEHDLVYTITSGDRRRQQNWAIVASNNDSTAVLGMGHFIQQAHFLNRPYDWYIDQASTGRYAEVNCGPSVATMACRWADTGFHRTVEDARATFQPDSSWWNVSSVGAWLGENDIPHTTRPIAASDEQTCELLASELDAGHLLILNMDMNDLHEAVPGSRIGLAYPSRQGQDHFFVVKGYLQVDHTWYFQVYDPACFVSGDGRDRYYAGSELFIGSSKWWPYYLVIGRKGESL